MKTALLCGLIHIIGFDGVFLEINGCLCQIRLSFTLLWIHRQYLLVESIQWWDLLTIRNPEWAPISLRLSVSLFILIFFLLKTTFELIGSEASYLRSLGVAVNHFYASKALKQTLSRMEHHILFSNIRRVMAASEKWDIRLYMLFLDWLYWCVYWAGVLSLKGFLWIWKFD